MGDSCLAEEQGGSTAIGGWQWWFTHAYVGDKEDLGTAGSPAQGFGQDLFPLQAVPTLGRADSFLLAPHLVLDEESVSKPSRVALGPQGPGMADPVLFLCFSQRLHARFYELAPNLVPMDYRKSPIVHVPMSLIIQMPELRVCQRPLLGVGAWGIHTLTGSRGPHPD